MLRPLFTTSLPFFTPHRLIHRGKTLGTLPLNISLQPGNFLIFAGQRWQITEIDDRLKMVTLTPAYGGRPPKFFAGQLRNMHERVLQEMYTVYAGTGTVPCLDRTAASLLEEGRKAFRAYHLDRGHFVPHEGRTVIFPWVGSKKLNTLRAALTARGLNVAPMGIALEVEQTSVERLVSVLQELAAQPPPTAVELAGTIENTRSAKYDDYLGEELLCLGYASSALDTQALPSIARKLVQRTVRF